MIRSLRRKSAAMSAQEAEACLKSETWGVLSLFGDDGYPYGVPVNYVWHDGAVLIHSASCPGNKLDGLRRNGKVCFTVVPEHRLDPERWSTDYRSVIVFGHAEILDDPDEKRRLMRSFTGILAPAVREKALAACDPGAGGLAMIRIVPVLITGKKNT